ncbi:MAG: barstar family protein [Ignavibacteriae bacterium]|nr:barstar family protein [Bacteroidota bacterium]MCB0605898.1 barstar family protein [Saprospiraceae bacterium]MCB0753426.1 barstar family protein [Ignavibacteriota bacterium]MCO5276614.1 barstar family protein [Saprospiraceae bacterium]HMT76156.1 barstar family protein [Saprospiraceae bacterium]
MKYIRIASPDTEIKRGNNKIIVEIEGHEVNDFQSLNDLLSDKLNFPNYFGENLDALFDMLVDLQWLKQDSIEFVISDFENLLIDEGELAKAELMLLLEDVCLEWKEGDFNDDEWEMKKFRVIILGDKSLEQEIDNSIELLLKNFEESESE